MHSLVTSNFNKSYNPNTHQNALSDIKRLLTSRDTSLQNKACGYLLDVINRFKENSREWKDMIECLLDNDMSLFLCDAICNLDFQLFKLVLRCIRLLWRSSRFFDGEHAAYATTAVLRALSHYANSSVHGAIDTCLHFLCDLFNCISALGSTSPLSSQSAYSIEQFLACMNMIISRINKNNKSILASSLVLHALISYQPEDLIIKSCTARNLTEVLSQWNDLLLATLNHTMLIGDCDNAEMLFAVICQLGTDTLRLIKLLNNNKQKTDFVQTIVTDEREINSLKQCASDMHNSVYRVISELVKYTKEHQNQIDTDEYGTFLVFLQNFLYNNSNTDLVNEFCDELYSKGYLMLLPHAQIVRKSIEVRKTSTLILGEMLKILSEKYLNVEGNIRVCVANDIEMGLVQLQSGIETPQNIGIQLQKSQPYSLLIYIYFYCQSSENPGEATAALLPYLIEYILGVPNTFTLPPYIIKSLWLVFAMSTISNSSLKSLDERIYLEKAIDRFLMMLKPKPSIYYTHNPAILLWSFTSRRITNFVRIQVLSQWLKTENYLPINLTFEATVWELLLNILVHENDKKIIQNCLNALSECIEESNEESQQKFASMIWTMLPDVLSRTLIDCNIETETNISYILELATTFLPLNFDQTSSLKIAMLITTLYSKYNEECSHYTVESVYHYEYVSLKLCLYLLGLANNHQDDRVLNTYVNRVGFMQNVLRTTNSMDDRVACAALQLLSYVVDYFNKKSYQPKTVLEIQSDMIVKSLRKDGSSERGASLLHLVYLMLNSNLNTPLVMSPHIATEPPLTQQCDALRTLMFRIQMLCCKEDKNQSSAGWKTLSSMFKHAITFRNDPQLAATLTSQPWTQSLINFQLTQNITQEFLTFNQNWLNLLKITIKKSQEEKRNKISKYSFTYTTLMRLKKKLIIDEQDKDFKEIIQLILINVNDILEECCISC